MTPRQRHASLLLVLVGIAAGYPTLARSKGQLCNSPGEEGRRVDLSLSKVSIDGVESSVTVAGDAGFLLETEFSGFEGLVHAS